MNRVLVLGVLACAMTPCFAHKIRVDYDRGANFSHYKTYSWVQPANQPPGAAYFNQLMQERIAGFIDEALACRGYKLVATGGDLLVIYSVDVTEQPVFTTFSNGFGPDWDGGLGWGGGWGGWGGGISTTTVSTYYEGTLVVDLADAKRQQLVFEGTSTHTISSHPEKNTKKLDKAVREVFEKYPPQQ
jgi:hypothetical protein